MLVQVKPCVHVHAFVLLCYVTNRKTSVAQTDHSVHNRFCQEVKFCQLYQLVMEDGELQRCVSVSCVSAIIESET